MIEGEQKQQQATPYARALSFRGMVWKIAKFDDKILARIEQETGLSALTAKLIAGRCPEETPLADFLHPQLRQLMSDPSHIIDMDCGVARLIEALQKNEPIAVFGDYDVDGACSSALFVHYWRLIGGREVPVYIPDRIKEGYGPNEKAFHQFKQQNISLVVTVDCGSSAFQAIDSAKKLGLEVIVIDHHMTEEPLESAFCLINPNRHDDNSGLGHLAAAGVVFMLLVALQRRLREKGFFQQREEPNLMHLLDFVALATVCDVVPLVGINRAFVRQGLKIMAQRHHMGLNALCDRARLKAPPTARDAGFVLGPRLNAAGRLQESDLSINLLLASNEEEAQYLAESLESLNQRRIDIEKEIRMQAIAKIDARGELPPVLYLSGKGWHWGVLGIVASRLARHYHRPVCVAGLLHGRISGSGRSVQGVDLGSAIIKARKSGIISAGGGHKMAAGFSLKIEQEEAFQLFLTQELGDQIHALSSIPELHIDALVTKGCLKEDFYNEMSLLEPFGTGNHEPRFVFGHMTIGSARRVGDGGHLAVTLQNIAGEYLKAIAFNAFDSDFGEKLEAQKNGAPLHIAGKIRLSYYQENKSLDIHIDDAAPQNMLLSAL